MCARAAEGIFDAHIPLNTPFFSVPILQNIFLLHVFNDNGQARCVHLQGHLYSLAAARVLHRIFFIVMACVKVVHLVLFTIVLGVLKWWNIFCTLFVTTVIAKEEKNDSNHKYGSL